jgi:hypothetical protein
MPITVTKPQSNFTQLDGPPMAIGIVPATVTKVTDLGMVAVNPLHAKTPGETKHKVEIVFTDANGGQARKDYTISLHEKSALLPLIVAVTGAQPTDGFDLETLVGRNITLITTKAVGKTSGKPYTKITTVAPAQPGQPVFKAPAKAAATQTPQTANVGW